MFSLMQVTLAISVTSVFPLNVVQESDKCALTLEISFDISFFNCYFGNYRSYYHHVYPMSLLSLLSLLFSIPVLSMAMLEMDRDKER